MPTGDLIEWRRDARGLATDVRVNGRDVVVFDHDAAGRPVLVHEPGRNRTLTLGWTRGGRLASLDVDGATMRWERDTDGLVVARHDPAGRRTTYARDRAGRLVATASDRWGAVELDRDLDGHLVALRADGVERRWDHDADGLVVGYRETAAGAARDHRPHPRRGRPHRRGPDRRRGEPLRLRPGRPAGLGGHPVRRLDVDLRRGRPVGDRGRARRADRVRVRRGPPARPHGGAGGTTGFSYDAAGRRTGEDGPAGTRAYTWDAPRSPHQPDDARRRPARRRRGRARPPGCPTATRPSRGTPRASCPTWWRSTTRGGHGRRADQLAAWRRDGEGRPGCRPTGRARCEAVRRFGRGGVRRPRPLGRAGARTRTTVRTWARASSARSTWAG